MSELKINDYANYVGKKVLIIDEFMSAFRYYINGIMNDAPKEKFKPWVEPKPLNELLAARLEQLAYRSNASVIEEQGFRAIAEFLRKVDIKEKE